MNRQHGLGLLELMIALLISSVLISGVLQVFSANKAAFRLQQSQGRMQEGARFALHTLSRQFRQAGYRGCSPRPATLTNALVNTPAGLDPAGGIQGWEYTAGGGTAPGSQFDLAASTSRPVRTSGNDSGWKGWTPGSGNHALQSRPRVVPGSDIIRVWYPNAESASVLDISRGSSWEQPTRIGIAAGHDIRSGDIVLLSDCVSATLLQVCRIENQTDRAELVFAYRGGDCALGNHTRLLPQQIHTNAEITPLSSSIYFIGKKAATAANPPSLYFASLNSRRHDGSSGNPMELVEGVETLQLSYGEDTDNDGVINQYRSADRVEDWQQVMAVKMGMLMRGHRPTDLPRQEDTFNVNDTRVRIDPADRRPRQVFNLTILLRNRNM